MLNWLYKGTTITKNHDGDIVTVKDVDVDYNSWMGHELEYEDATELMGEPYWSCKIVDGYLNELWDEFAEGATLEACQRDAFNYLSTVNWQYEMDI